MHCSSREARVDLLFHMVPCLVILTATYDVGSLFTQDSGLQVQTQLSSCPPIQPKRVYPTKPTAFLRVSAVDR